MNPETGGLKILVIDDSPFYRQILQGALLGMDGVREVQTAEDGEKAIRMVLASPPDAITLDLKMPGMDGFTFLRWLMKNHPIPVLVISSEGEGKNVFKALDLGALDFIVKPPPRASVRMEGIREELKEKIAAIAGSDLPSRLARFSSGRRPVEEAGGGPSVAVSLPAAVPGVGILVIGSSTGGPSAVQRVLTDLGEGYPFPVIVVQHMPPVFTRQFAQRLEKNTGFKCREGKDMDRLSPGQILVVPGGYHLAIRRGGARLVRVFEKKEGDRYVPSVDITMQSVGQRFGPLAIGVLLTGMGNDGAQGLLEIRKSGGFTIAESEESAVVFGMPRSAVQMGAACAVLPLDRIGRKVLEQTAILTGLKNMQSDDKK